MHVNAVISFAAVSLQVKLTEFLFLIRHNQLMFKFALFPLCKHKRQCLSITSDHCDKKLDTQASPYLDAATLKEVLADVSTVVLNRMLTYELLAHDWSLLLKARGAFSLLQHKINENQASFL